MSAPPTTAEVRAEIAHEQRLGVGSLNSRCAALKHYALPIAEHRDALAAEVARLREALAASAARAATSADALTTIALAAGLGADATAEEVAKRVGEMARTLSLIGTWRHEHGAALKPSRADTYGDGMRAAKGQVGAILSHLALEAGRG